MGFCNERNKMKYYITKKVGDKIMGAVPKMLQDKGFTSLPVKNWHDFTKETEGGTVEISVRYEKAYKKRGYSICIFGVYSDAKKAVSVGILCNEYSGKCNHHFILDEKQLSYCLDQYK